MVYSKIRTVIVTSFALVFVFGIIYKYMLINYLELQYGLFYRAIFEQK